MVLFRKYLPAASEYRIRNGFGYPSRCRASRLSVQTFGGNTGTDRCVRIRPALDRSQRPKVYQFTPRRMLIWKTWYISPCLAMSKMNAHLLWAFASPLHSFSYSIWTGLGRPVRSPDTRGTAGRGPLGDFAGSRLNPSGWLHFPDGQSIFCVPSHQKATASYIHDVNMFRALS